MKTEPVSDSDPITAAAAALALAVDQAQRATSPSPPCSALQAKVTVLEGVIQALNLDASIARTQRDTELAPKDRDIVRLEETCTALREGAEIRRQELCEWDLIEALNMVEDANGKCKVLHKQVPSLQASAAKERTTLAGEREDLATDLAQLTHAKENLRKDRAYLEDEQARLRANLANLKRTVGPMQAEMSKQEQSLPAAASAYFNPSGSPRKRQRN
ncbi:hypothetical protein DFH09DRAFT_1099672 [Mycena vulgaris]|nr:hypothetical protein DFH09DRAFT_1099672 [Mycena vulgaris]